MSAKHTILASLGLACSLLMPALQAAESGTVQAAVPWEGEGRVFRVSPDKLLFLGAIEGIMYIESSKGAMHEAFIVCPIMQDFDIETGATEARGKCEVTASSETVLFAELTCKGEVGNCVGEFKLAGGLGEFSGISGSGKLRVRSPIRALAADLGSGAVLRVASGLAIINDLKYRIP